MRSRWRFSRQSAHGSRQLFEVNVTNHSLTVMHFLKKSAIFDSTRCEAQESKLEIAPDSFKAVNAYKERGSDLAASGADNAASMSEVGGLA